MGDELTPEEISQAIQMADGKWQLGVQPEFLENVANSVAKAQLAKIKHRTRPELDEIAKLIGTEGEDDDGWETSWFFIHKDGLPYKLARLLLALYPDIETIQREGREKINNRKVRD